MKRLNRFVALFLASILPSVTLANPVGGTVVGGSATISGQGTAVTTINQRSHNAVINWQGFSVAAGEITRFNQPSATASILNRVISGNPTEIYGTLQGNGRIFVINPNGILVGRGGVVDTAGFMASTRNIANANPFSRNLSLSGDSTAAVRNEGTIRALGGDVFLIGHSVENSGTISAPKGTVGLAAGSQISLVQSGNEHLSVVAGSGSAETGVNNQGVIDAASAELKAAGGNIYSLAINNGGAIRANTLVNEGGRIVLRASGGSIRNTGSLTANKANGNGGEIVLDGGHSDAAPSTVTSSGSVQARGDQASSRGGKIQVTGDHVGLFDDSIFDVSGDHGGGSVIVGGDFRGANPNVQNAEAVYVSPNAQIRADALTSGNGGNVAVWSDGATRFYGSVSAQGGSHNGNGGFVETSGHYLDFNGHVSTFAPHGLIGSLLLDPINLTINNAADNNVSGGPIFTPTGAASVLTWGTISGVLGSSDVTVTTVGTGTGGAGNITIAAGTILNSSHNLTITADGALTINSSSAIQNTGTGGLNLNAGDDITINSSITLTGGGALSVHSGSDGAGDIDFGASVTISANSQTYQAGDGAGGGTTGDTDLVGNTPTFLGAAGGATSPALFVHRQDSQIQDNEIVAASQFGAAPPALYTIQSDDNALTLSTGSKVNGSALTLIAADAISLNDSSVARTLTLASLTVHSGTDSGGDISFVTGLTIRADTQSYTAGESSGTAEIVDFHPGTALTDPRFVRTDGTDGLTSFTFQQDHAVAAADLPASAQFNNTLPSSYTIISAGSTVTLPAMTLPGTLTVQAHGAITQSGALTANAGASTFTVEGVTADVTLNQANDFGSQTVTINAIGGSGALDDVTLQGAGTGTISLSLPSAMNSLTLQLGGGVSLSALTVNNNASITAEGVVDFAGATASLITGNLNITTDTTTSGFDVMQNGVGPLTVGGISTFKTGTANVSLNKTGDNFNNVTITSANNVDLTDANAINLNNLTIAGYLHVNAGGKVDFTGTGASTIGNDLNIVSATGGIVDSGSGSLRVSNGSTLAAGSANDINLNNGNDFIGAVNIVSANNVTLHDINALTVGGSMNGNLTTTATTTTTFNTLAVGGNLSATAAGLVDFAGSGASSITGTMGITTTAGGITDSGSGSLAVGGAATLTAGPLNNITLDNNNNNFNSVRIVSANNVTLMDNNAIVLAGPSTVSGTLNVTAGGTISQSGGALIVTGGASTFTINTVAADIQLGSQANDFGNQTVTFNTIGGGTLVDASFRNISALASATSLSLPSSLHTLTLQFDAAGVNLPTLTLTGDLNVTAAGLVDFIGAGASTVAGNMNISTTTGGINDSGTGSLAVSGTSTLSAGLANNITLDNFNNFNTVTVSSGNNVTLFDVNAIALGASTVAGALSVTAGGNISQSGALSVIAGPSTFTINGVTADILIGTQPNHFDGQTVTFNTAGGGLLRDVSFRNVDAATSLPVISSAGTLRNFSLQLDNAGVSLPTINLTGDLNVIAAGLVDFSGAGASTIGGNMSISTTAGGVTESGGGTITVAGLSTLGAGALNNITLNNNNDFNTVTITSGNNVTLNDINGINFGDIHANGNVTLNAGGLVDFIGSGASTIGGTLGITTFGPINDSGSGSLAVTGTTTLDATFGNDVTLDNLNNDFSTVVVNSGQNITLRDLNALNLGHFIANGNMIVNAGGKVDFIDSGLSGTVGNLNVTTPTGGITESGSGSLTVLGTATLSAGAASDITLVNAANDFNVVVISSANNVTLNDQNGVNFGNLNINGNFGLTAGGLVDFVGSGASSIGAAMSINTTTGGINDSGSGSLAVVGPSTLTAGFGNNIRLDNNNNFSSVAIVSANNVTLTDINALTVGGALAGTLTTTAGGATTLNATTAGGGANITAAGDITETGVLSFTGGPSTFTINGVTANILLGSQANHFDAQAVTIAAINGGTVNDVNFRSTDVGALSPALPATVHDLTLFFDNAGVALSSVAIGGDLNITANGPITDNAAFTVAGTTTLNATGNDIVFDAGDDFGGAVTIVNANNVFLSDVNALTVGGSMNGNLVTSVGTTTTFNTTTVGGNLTSVGNGLISQNGNLTVVGTSTLLAGFGSDILLNGANDFGGAVTIGSAANVTLNDINNLTVGGSLGGNLNTTAAGATTFNSLNVGGNLNAVGGPITQNAFTTVIVGGTTTLTAGGGNDIILANGNDFGGAVTIVSGNNVTLNDVNALAVSGAIGANLNATAGGALTVGGTVGNNFTGVAGGPATLNALAVGGNMVVTANGISDTANVTVTGTTTLAGGSGDIVLDNADDFGGAVTILNGNNVTLNDINSLTVGGSMNGTLTTTAAGATTFNTVNAGGDLNATAGGQVDFAGSGASTVAGSMTIITPTGGITDSGSGSLAVGGTSTLTAGAANNITLDNNNNFNTVVIASGNNVTLNDINAINLGNATVSGNLAVTAGGLVALIGSGASTVAGTLNIATTSGGIQDSGTGTLTVTGTSTLAGSPGGDIILDNANDFGGAVTVNSGHNVTLNDINALTVAATASGNLTTTAGGPLVVGGSVGGNLTGTAVGTATLNAITVAGNASITATGDITDNGNVNVAGNSTFTTTGGNNIILDSAGNTFGGSVDFVASSGTLQNVTVTDSDAGGFVISQIAVTDTLNVSAGGDVTQSGNITADTLNVSSTAGSVTLGAAVPNIPDPAHPPSIFVSAAYTFDNTVNSVSGHVDGSGQFIFNGHNSNPANDLNVNDITTHNGTIALQSDRLNIQGHINAGAAGDIFLQPVTGTKIDVGGSAASGLDPFHVDSDELHLITGRALVIGSATVNEAFVDPNLIIRNNPAHVPNNTDSAGALNVDFILLPANISDLNVFVQALAALSSVNIPLPKLQSFDFSGANLTAEEAKKLLPEGSKGELFLQLPMPVLQETQAKVEERSKWTSGRVAASGSTAGPQTPQ